MPTPCIICNRTFVDINKESRFNFLSRDYKSRQYSVYLFFKVVNQNRARRRIKVYWDIISRDRKIHLILISAPHDNFFLQKVIYGVLYI